MGDNGRQEACKYPVRSLRLRGRLGITELGNELLERGHALLADEVELEHEEDEVLEAGVQVSVGTNALHLGEVRPVDVSIETEQALVDILDGHHEVARELGIFIDRESLGIRNLLAHPIEQQVNVNGSRHTGGLLVVHVVLPQIFVSASGHGLALLLGTKLGACTINHVCRVIEVDSVDSNPLVEVLALRELDSLLELTTTQSSLHGGIDGLLEIRATLRQLLSGLEGLVTIPERVRLVSVGVVNFIARVRLEISLVSVDGHVVIVIGSHGRGVLLLDRDR